MFFQHKAPKLVWTENKNWLHSKPLTWESLRDKLILLDFWTYSCINCLRTLPALKQIWEKYQNKKFILIGVHTPEFDFEKDLVNVQKAARKHELEYPILNDPERINWENYGNTYWPRAALINADGELIMDHVGESGYDEIEEAIIKELRKMKQLEAASRIKEEKHYYAPNISPEIYAGSSRNAGLGSAKVCSKRGCDEFYDAGKYHQDIIYVQGDWKQTSEYLEFMGDKGHIAFQYYAKEVNVVMEGKGLATIFLNDKPLMGMEAGKDVRVSQGKSLAHLEGADLYQLVHKPDYQQSVLKIIPFKGLKVYAYTFG